jgi:vacuolar iron transporter family protein
MSSSLEAEKKSDHFKGKSALQHLAEKQSEGAISTTESHGTETPGHISSFADSARELAFLLLITGAICYHLLLPPLIIFQILTLFSASLIIWKTGRSSWLGWSRMERLHRLVEQERWEIQNHRPQEREELYALYGPKGFEGQLLEEVVDVLMADDDKLLRIMLEEEMGLRLQCHEHPLKQGLGGGLGAFFAALLCLLGTWFSSFLGLFFGAGITVACAATLSAIYEKNRKIPAIVWNLSIMYAAFSVVYFMLAYIST